ncbi:MAG TPA: DUF2167 domain-containing protein [Burkholderiales bacterium]|nr:DUF2167 domain-containing protein [Burkholderiales bacterium]
MKISFYGAALLLACMSFLASAQEEVQEDPFAKEVRLAVEAARAVAQDGPAEIPLTGQAVLKLPPGYVFIPQKEAGALMTAWGNRTGPDLLGMVVPAGDDEWFVVLSYEASGYIRDDDAKEWDADELLSGLREGTLEANKERARRGIPEMEIVGWAQTPSYDAQTHRLRWSLASRDIGAPPDAPQGVNYNTYALGREGYISLNLVTDLGAISKDKAVAEELLGALHFDQGKRYADFNESTDRVAEYGLAALVAGVAAKKLGMFALIAAFFAKFAKVIGLAAIAGGAGLFKYFKRNKDQS